MEPLQRALSCASPSVVNVGGGYYPRNDPHILVLGDGGPQRLRESDLTLSIFQQYHVIPVPDERGPWKVSIAGYVYIVEDGNGAEVIGYHWHPFAQGEILAPHLHLGAGSKVGRVELSRAHLPTGRVSVEDLLTTLFRDFAVRPLRDDWPAVLEETRRAFEVWRSW